MTKNPKCPTRNLFLLTPEAAIRKTSAVIVRSVIALWALKNDWIQIMNPGGMASSNQNNFSFASNKSGQTEKTQISVSKTSLG